MSNTNKGSLSFKIHGIELVSFTLHPRVKPDYVPNAVSFDVTIQHQIDQKQRLLIVFITVLIKEQNSENDLAKVTTGIGFEIENFNELINAKTDNTFDVPVEMGTLFNSIAVSTTRGIMFSELKGTYLQGVILPVVDPKDFHPNKQPF